MRSRATKSRRARGGRAAALLGGALLAAGCAAGGAPRQDPEAAPPRDDPPQPRDEREAEPFPPRPESTGSDDWIRLTSGEWLRGKLSTMDRERTVFDSKELKELHLDWEDVAEVVTEAPFTLLLTDRSTVVGVPRVEGDTIRVSTADGERRLDRDEVQAFVRGRPTERNYWSGKVRLGGTVRSGNTDQVDGALSVAARRRTAASRLRLSLDSVVGSVDGSESINNHTFRGSLDYFISPRVYARPLGLELFRDRFQNIELRASPYTALGYLVVDRPGTEWDVTGGLGYRYTRFDSVEEGEDDHEDQMTAVLGTALTHDLTDDVDLALAYNAQVGLEDTRDTNQDASLSLSFDFLWDLEFEVRALWKRVGLPEADADGETPDKEDLRLDLGVSWKF